MKMNTVVISVKGLCYLTIGVFTPWAAALAQWIGTGEWPPRIVWIAVILPASAIGGASQLLSFLSNAFGQYKEERRTTDTQILTKP